MSTSKGELMDARQVRITPGARVVYGFGVSRSVAMAEAVVEADPQDPSRVSVTPSGRIHLRVVRRSYAQGRQPVVDVAADRMTVVDTLPFSPLPTQDEHLYDRLTATMKRRLNDIERLSTGGQLDRYEIRRGYNKLDDPDRIAYYLNLYRKWEARDRKQLEECCGRLEREMPV